ncbi:centrosomal protein of 164 kDa-like isoform X2 [Trichomycterus rosablanca]|uniref:centrosomal protein of 164 kDa-like isoform X2 n=1 Tax=Trichomycterus rosablanca TaxID=2290929 RepID=UPI002F354A0B
MNAASLQIGDQLILEEDYDEGYIPSEQEIHEYAREIGIDPAREPELLWLAREGIVAPLPAEWKPCQDVTGDVYYFNFSTGQSTWDHPCDEQYRHLVAQERERASGSAPAKKDREKKKKKEKKKEKRKSEQEGLKPPGSADTVMLQMNGGKSRKGKKECLNECKASSSAAHAPVPLTVPPALYTVLPFHPLSLPSTKSTQGQSSLVEPGVQRCHRPVERGENALSEKYSDGEILLVKGMPIGRLSDRGSKGKEIGSEGNEDFSVGCYRQAVCHYCSDTDTPERSTIHLPQQHAERQGALEHEVKDTQSLGLLGPLGPLAPLRSVCDAPVSALRGSLGSSSSLQPLKTSLGGVLSGVSSGLFRGRADEQQTSSVPSVFHSDSDEDEEVERRKTSVRQSPRGPSRLLQNLHLDLDALGGGLQYEDSEVSGTGPAEERTEPELQDLALSAENSPEPPSRESEISEHVEAVSCGSDDFKVGFRSKFSENILDLSDLWPAKPSSAASEENEKGEEVKEIRPKAAQSRFLKSLDSNKPPSDHAEELLSPPSSSSLFKHEEVRGGEKVKEEERRKQESDERRKQEEKKREEAERRREEKEREERRMEEKEQEKEERRKKEEKEKEEKLKREQREEEERRISKETEARRKEEARRSNEERQKEERETQREMVEEKLRAKAEHEERLRLLREELRKEEEEEEQRMKEENAEKIRALNERLKRERVQEEQRLDQETQAKLQQLREQALKEREAQLHTLREESEEKLRELSAQLEAERESLEAQRRRDLDNLKAESEEELRREKKRLEERRDEQLASLRLEGTTSDPQREMRGRSPRPEYQLMEYKRELTQVLQEVREEVQREHNRKLERLKEEHRHQIQARRETQLEEEQTQRERLQSTLQDERDRLLTSHATQMEQLTLQLDSQLHKCRTAHTRKEAEVQELIEKLELKTKELKSQESRLQAQEAELKRRRRQLCEEEDEVERGLEILPRLLKERDRLRAELERAREESDRARDELDREKQERKKEREERERVKEERQRLQSKVELLQDKCDRLSQGVSQLEQRESMIREEEEKKDVERMNRKREEELRVEDLEPRDSQNSLDNLREFISSESVSLQRARRFLDQQSGNLGERQEMLKVARTTQPDHQLHHSVQQEVNQLEELQETVQRGHTLLKTKEERLNQLENSLAEELSYEDGERTDGERRVTFDVSDSETSSVYGQEETVPVKVHQLAESLQQISGQINTVIGALLPLTQKTSTPLTRSSTVPPVPGPSWAWPPNSIALSSIANQNGFTHNPVNGITTPRGSDLLISNWRKLLPGVSNDTSTSFPTRAHTAYSAYTAPSLSSIQSKPSEMDSLRLQGLIDGNKRWLETRRKDMPLFTRYRTPSSTNGLVQLSLDENNQIRMHHY